MQPLFTGQRSGVIPVQQDEEDTDVHYWITAKGFHGVDLFETGAKVTDWNLIKSITVNKKEIILTSRKPSECTEYWKEIEAGDTVGDRLNAIYDPEENTTTSFFKRNISPVEFIEGEESDKERTFEIAIDENDDGARAFWIEKETQINVYKRNSKWFGKVEKGSAVNALQTPEIIVKVRPIGSHRRSPHNFNPKGTIISIPSFAHPEQLFKEFGLVAQVVERNNRNRNRRLKG